MDIIVTACLILEDDGSVEMYTRHSRSGVGHAATTIRHCVHPLGSLNDLTSFTR